MELVDTLDLGSSAARCMSSSLIEATYYFNINASLVQLIERVTCTHEVAGLTPARGSTQ